MLSLVSSIAWELQQWELTEFITVAQGRPLRREEARQQLKLPWLDGWERRYSYHKRSVLGRALSVIYAPEREKRSH